jgi:hypothetical protein
MNDILQTYLPTVLASAGTDFKLFADKLGARMSAKLRSEIISALLENNMERYIPHARAGTSDREADVYIQNVPLEIKTAFNARDWRGGEYSKRRGDFLLISWTVTTTNELAWFAVHTLLTEQDWKSSGSQNYYATTVTLDAVLQNGQSTVLIGDIRQARKLKHPVFTAV